MPHVVQVNGLGLMRGVVPVSYTHLDVYKRQARACGNQVSWDAIFLRYETRGSVSDRATEVVPRASVFRVYRTALFLYMR